MTLSDLRRIEANSIVELDLAIVGSGPAGLAIASEFLDTRFRVAVFESGGLTHDRAFQDINEHVNAGHRRAPSDVCRSRGLGGTSELWTGRCGLFDAIDFQRRGWVPHSGWPIDAAELAPFTARAESYLGLVSGMSGSAALDVLRQSFDDPVWNRDAFVPVVWQFSSDSHGDRMMIRQFTGRHSQDPDVLGILGHTGAPRARQLGKALLPYLRASRSVEVFVNATALEIEASDEGRRVTGLVLSTPEGKRIRARAPRIVVACGGIENARLLLASRSAMPCGLGNARDQVGRYLADHTFSNLGTYCGEGPTRLRRRLGSRWLDREGERHVFNVGLGLSPEMQGREELLNASVHLVEYGTDVAAIAGLGASVRALRSGGNARRAIDGCARALRHPVEIAGNLIDRLVFHRPSLNHPNEVVIGCSVEQALDPDSRVTLADQKDMLGQSRACIDWRVSEPEYRTARRVWELLTADVERLGYSLPASPRWVDEGFEAWKSTVHDLAHPMCATRMSDDPSTGVVDAQCQVHGVEGLCVVGGSVFATPGHMNPTQMIVTLAFRLAHDLKRKMQDRDSQAVAA